MTHYITAQSGEQTLPEVLLVANNLREGIDAPKHRHTLMWNQVKSWSVFQETWHRSLSQSVGHV